MPDPFLEQFDLEIDYQKSQNTARLYGAHLWRKGRHVFLECRGFQKKMYLARIDCDGYPQTLPDVTFLDPVSKQPTSDRQCWPVNIPCVTGPQGFGLCLAGTQSYVKHHHSTTVKYKLNVLVEIVILCCLGQALAIRPVR